MTVRENVAYGLMVKGVGRRERGAARRRGADHGPARRPRRAQADPALRRPAPARRARARARQPAAGAAARRAARRARPQAAPADAARAQGHPARAERADHVHLRHARPGRGADDERPHRRVLGTAGSSRSARPGRSTSTRRTSSSPASSAPRTSSSATARRFTVRPEKIRLLDGRRRGPGRRWTARAGAVREVVYLGSVTRYVVELDERRDAGRAAPEPRHDGGRGARRSAAGASGWRGRRSTPTRFRQSEHEEEETG